MIGADDAAAMRTLADTALTPTPSEAELNSSVTPAGAPARARATVPANPSRGVTVTHTSRDSPGRSNTEAGAIVTSNRSVDEGAHIATPSLP